MAFARCGQSQMAQAIIDEIIRQAPQGTIANNVYAPLIKAAIELNRNNPDKALQIAQSTLPYENVGKFQFWHLCGEIYLRLNDGPKAAAEYQKILDRRGWGVLSPFYPLAHLGLARAAALSDDVGKSRKAYEDFFTLWKDADADLPILLAAKQEYAKLK
jgi:predicted Zn-dependent protease